MTFIIAEAGVNHNGDLRQAEKLIVAAKQTGADAVKFQLFDADKLKRPEIKWLQISQPDMHGLKLYAERQRIEFLCTPFDVESLEFLVRIGVKRLKIGSGCLTNKNLLEAAKKSNLPIILSTGMSTLTEIDNALEILGYGQPCFYVERDIALLHCTSAYPCPLEDVNLRALEVMNFRWGERCKLGYSDHTEGILASLSAVARGADIIEKHLTLDRTAAGPNHLASIEPYVFETMVTSIRSIEILLGDRFKKSRLAEESCRKIWR